MKGFYCLKFINVPYPLVQCFTAATCCEWVNSYYTVAHNTITDRLAQARWPTLTDRTAARFSPLTLHINYSSCQLGFVCRCSELNCHCEAKRETSLCSALRYHSTCMSSVYIRQFFGICNVYATLGSIWHACTLDLSTAVSVVGTICILFPVIVIKIIPLFIQQYRAKEPHDPCSQQQNKTCGCLMKIISYLLPP